MADNTIAQAYVQLMPSVEGISGQLSSALSGEINKAEGSTKGGFSVMKGAVSNFVTQGLNMAVNGVKSLASSTVDTGKTFEASMSQVAATMGVSVDQIQDLSEFAKEMGANTAFSASEAAQALNYMALAGYDADTSMKMLPTVLDLAAAGSIDLANASDMVTDASAALGLSIVETKTMVDQMAAASSHSNTSVAQLGDAMLKIGATARSVNGGTQELSTVLGVLADNGIKGAEGGTHLRNMLLSLQNPTDAGATALEALGVSVYDADGNMRSLIDIIGEMQTGMAGMTQESKDAMISGIFNKTDLAAVNALINTSSDRFDELSEAIGASGGAAQTMADTQLDNLEGKMTIMKSAWEGFQLTLYDTVNGPIGAVVETITNELIPGLTDLISGVEGSGEQIGEAVGHIIDQIIESVVAIAPELVSAVVTLADAVIMSVSEHAPEIVSAVVEILPTIAENILNEQPTIVGATMEITTAVLNGLAEALPEIVNSVVEVIPELIDEIVAQTPAMLEASTNFLMAIVEAIPEIITQLLEQMPHIVETILNGLMDAIPQLFDASIEFFMGIIDAIPEIIDALIENLPKIIDTIITTLLGNIDKLVDASIRLLMGIVDAIPKILTILVKKLPEIITTIVNTLLQHLPELVMGAVQLFMGLIEAIPLIIIELVKNLPEIITAIVTGLGEGFGQIFDVGANLLAGLWEGIQSGISSLWDGIVNLGNDIVNWFANIFQVQSPSKRFAWMGEMLMEGLGMGIEDGSDYALDAIDNLSDGLIDAVSGTDLSMDMSASIGANAGFMQGMRNTLPASAQGGAAGAVTINVYGAEGQSVNELAEVINQKLQHIYDRRMASYA